PKPQKAAEIEAPQPAGERHEPPPKAEAPRPAPSRPTARKAREWMGRTLGAEFADTPGDLGLGRVEDRVAASPLARRVADELGVPLKQARGSGPGGRIQKPDVEEAAKRGPAAPGAAPTREDVVLRASPMRKTIAKRLLQSHQDLPTFFLTANFDMQGFVDLR